MTPGPCDLCRQLRIAAAFGLLDREIPKPAGKLVQGHKFARCQHFKGSRKVGETHVFRDDVLETRRLIQNFSSKMWNLIPRSRKLIEYTRAWAEGCSSSRDDEQALKLARTRLRHFQKFDLEP